jgi:hypothetical protein
MSAVVAVVAAVMTPAVAEAIVAVHRRVAAIDGSHFAGVADGFGRRALFANRRRGNGFAAFASRSTLSDFSITPTETVAVSAVVPTIAVMAVTTVMTMMTVVSTMAVVATTAVPAVPAVTTFSLSRTRAHNQGDGDQQTGERQEFNEAKHDSFSSE